MTLAKVVELDEQIHVADIGAAAIAEMPPYKVLLDEGLARLSAVDGDERHHAGIVETYGPATRVYGDVLADGKRHILHIADAESGMTSILAPSEKHLSFFNGFDEIGAIRRREEVETRRLADVPGLQQIDYLKMDIQGAELLVLENAGDALRDCVAIHLEAPFIPLYEGQASFGELDLWMRQNGYLPHRLTFIKCWSIAPTLRRGDPRIPFNQLLECDIVYVRDLVELKSLSDLQLKKLALIAWYCYDGPDLCLHAVGELERRGALPSRRSAEVVGEFNAARAAANATRGR